MVLDHIYFLWGFLVNVKLCNLIICKKKTSLGDRLIVGKLKVVSI
jgi:hypothetical protein